MRDDNALLAEPTRTLVRSKFRTAASRDLIAANEI